MLKWLELCKNKNDNGRIYKCDVKQRKTLDESLFDSKKLSVVFGLITKLKKIRMTKLDV